MINTTSVGRLSDVTNWRSEEAVSCCLENIGVQQLLEHTKQPKEEPNRVKA